MDSNHNSTHSVKIYLRDLGSRLMARKKRNPKSVELANRIISEYAPGTVEDVNGGYKM